MCMYPQHICICIIYIHIHIDARYIDSDNQWWIMFNHGAWWSMINRNVFYLWRYNCRCIYIQNTKKYTTTDRIKSKAASRETRCLDLTPPQLLSSRKSLAHIQIAWYIAIYSSYRGIAYAQGMVLCHHLFLHDFNQFPWVFSTDTDGVAGEILGIPGLQLKAAARGWHRGTGGLWGRNGHRAGAWGGVVTIWVCCSLQIWRTWLEVRTLKVSSRNTFSKVTRRTLKTLELGLRKNCDHKACQSAVWSKYFEHPQSPRFRTPEASMIFHASLGLNLMAAWAAMACHLAKNARSLSLICSRCQKPCEISHSFFQCRDKKWPAAAACHRVIVSRQKLCRNMPETDIYKKMKKSLFAESSCGGSNLHFFSLAPGKRLCRQWWSTTEAHGNRPCRCK